MNVTNYFEKLKDEIKKTVKEWNNEQKIYTEVKESMDRHILKITNFASKVNFEKIFDKELILK